MRASSNCSNAAKSKFCRSMRNANTRFRNCVIGGNSSLSEPSWSQRSTRLLELRQRTALDPPGMQQLVEPAQCGLGIGAFEIVVGAEETLVAGLALAAGDRAERVEAAGDRRQKALLALTSVATGRNTGGCFWLVR